MVVGCWGPRQQGRTSSTDYVTPVTAVPVRLHPRLPSQLATGRHPSCGIPVSLSSPSSIRTQEGCKVTGETPRSPPTLARSLTLSSPFLPYYVLRSRPPSRPTPPSTTTLSHPRESTRKTTATPARLPHGAFPTQPRPSLSLESPQGPLGSQG